MLPSPSPSLLAVSQPASTMAMQSAVVSVNRLAGSLYRLIILDFNRGLSLARQTHCDMLRGL